ncbi:hypothetical protein ABPG72_000292 [Tetrahymena utriculariae]
MNNHASFFEEEDSHFYDFHSNSIANTDLSNTQQSHQDSFQQNNQENAYPVGFFDNFDQISYQQLQSEQQDEFNNNLNSSKELNLKQGVQINQNSNNVKPTNNARIPIKEKVRYRKQKLYKQQNGQTAQQQQKKPSKQQQIGKDIHNQNQESASTDTDNIMDEDSEKVTSPLQKKIKKKGNTTDKNKVKQQNTEHSLLENDEQFKNLDKKAQQKIKNRMSAQKSRDDRKKHLLQLQKNVNSLTEQVKNLEEQNQDLKSKLENNICSKCNSQCITEDSQSGYDDYIEDTPIFPYGGQRYNNQFKMFGMNATSSFAVIFCICLIGIQIHNSSIETIQTRDSNAMVFLQQNNQQISENMRGENCDNDFSIISPDQNALSVYSGIDKKLVQQSQIINTKLINGFGKPGSSIDSIDLLQDKQNDEIICPNSYIILYKKDPNEKHNIINLTLTNQTNFYSAYDGQYYPLYQDDQGGQIKLTCLILKYEQITDSQQNL